MSVCEKCGNVIGEGSTCPNEHDESSFLETDETSENDTANEDDAGE